MKHRADADANPYLYKPMIAISDDGYIRLTLEVFLTIPLVHFMSGLNEEKLILSVETLPQGASLACISGYTEWLSNMVPNITLGWDWFLDVSTGRPHYVRLGEARSNIMLIDTMQHDLGPTKTSGLLSTTIDALAWQEVVHRFIVSRYTH